MTCKKKRKGDEFVDLKFGRARVSLFLVVFFLSHLELAVSRSVGFVIWDDPSFICVQMLIFLSTWFSDNLSGKKERKEEGRS